MTDMSPADLAVQKLRRAIAEKLAAVPAASISSALLLKLLGLSDIELLDEIFSRVEANPDRIGCPPTVVLVDLASSDTALTHSAWDHLMTCFECRTDVRLMRAAGRSRARPKGDGQILG